MKNIKTVFAKLILLGGFLFFILQPTQLFAEDGYNLWLRYKKIENTELLKKYQSYLKTVQFEGTSPTLLAAQKELKIGLEGILGIKPDFNSFGNSGMLMVKKSHSKEIDDEGFLIQTLENHSVLIEGKTDIGILYGVFRFLQMLQQEKDISNLNILDAPKTRVRILNHWDNLDRSVERGYAGFSLWDWFRLPEVVDPRYTDYARANASVGINGTVITNVNANALILTPTYLEKVAKLADVFRPYGIKIYLTARFSAPIELDNLETADPLNEEVQEWWKKKAAAIYSYIPDFGGFLVKANSEGQPGPQNYERNHAEGANLLADAVAPFGGIVVWRAFVYDQHVPEDRAKQAFNEFKPLDGKFRENVIIQVKNGAIDFQPREPFHPLFGAIEKSNLMMEFQITQEYLGFSTHLVYLAPLFEECLKADTYAKGAGSLVAKSIDGSLHGQKLTGIAGVTNIVTVRNWCGHPFAQANWYAFGRLAWDPYLNSNQIANEWIRMTFNNNQQFVSALSEIMMNSHEVCVNYMTPLGLHHIMGRGHHHGPGPWVTGGRPDWTSVYYHRADSIGIGFNRTKTGSKATEQYFEPVANKFDNINTCPEKYLLWFHHVPWDYKVKSGNTLWDEMCYRYDSGVQSVRKMQLTWNELENFVDEERFKYVQSLLKIQEKEAVWWRNSCLLYFQTFSKLPLPENIEKADKTAEEYMNITEFYMPGH